MPSDPPKALERVVGLLLPPACREEVLGDLCEKYKSPWQYVTTAARVVPSVILSRIRRTTDFQVLVIETSVLYGAYIASAWHQNHASLHEPELRHLAIPTIETMAVLVLERAWDQKFASIFTGVVVGISVYFDATGGFTGLLIISGVRILLPPETAKLQQVTGPALTSSKTAWTAVVGAAAGALAAAIVLVGFGLKPGMASVVIAVLGVTLGSRMRKE
jgi:hypothetical protein